MCNTRATGRRSRGKPDNSDRAQASLTVLEAGVGLLLLFGILFTFALGVPDSDRMQSQAQLDVYASDTATLLSNEAPRHRDQTRLAEVTESVSTFEREKAELERRVERILPENVLFRVETKHGTVGHPLPTEVPTGDATVITVNGAVTLRVWYV